MDYQLDPAVMNGNGTYGGTYKDPAVKEENTVAIIQSRGLGDLIIALPIARWYADQGKTVYWPICEEFYATMRSCAPWVNWIRIKTDQRGEFFYQNAVRALKYIVPEEQHICLYQYLSSMPELSDPDIFPILKFDQYKYAVAGVPFLRKWTLNECIVRDSAGEQAVWDTVVRKKRYIVTHLRGSDASIDLDFSQVDPSIQIIRIEPGITDNALNWLKVIEGAEALFLIDSVYANLVDQLNIAVEKTFIRRSKMDLTPVLGSDWQYMSPP